MLKSCMQTRGSMGPCLQRLFSVDFEEYRRTSFELNIGLYPMLKNTYERVELPRLTTREQTVIKNDSLIPTSVISSRKRTPRTCINVERVRSFCKSRTYPSFELVDNMMAKLSFPYNLDSSNDNDTYKWKSIQILDRLLVHLVVHPASQK